ncbi:MAG: YhcH/YjgK/YiaL family protein [Phycisphaerae bacterium]|nr:YhcH/YjgK/YiaL family protein [Phycisphaerae bacterium]
MIIDTLAHAAAYRPWNNSIAKAIDFLRRTDLAALSDGRIELTDNAEFAIVQRYTTQPADTKRWEAHRTYLDFQYVVEGTEWMGYAPTEHLTVVEPYDAAKDIEWLEGEGSFIRLPAGSFAILLPQDAHKPGIALAQPEAVKKIVFKLKAAAWPIKE